MEAAKTAPVAPAAESDILREVVIPTLVVMGGLFVQMQWSAWLGLAVIAGGFWYGYAQGWGADPRLNLSPRLTSGAGKRWVQVTATEVGRIKKKMEIIDNLGPGCLWGLLHLGISLVVFVVGMGTVGVLTKGLGHSFSEEMLGTAFLDLVFLGIWYFWICAPNTWKPHLVEFKLPVFEALLAGFPAKGLGKWSREYQLELAKGEKGEVPTDLKLMIKPPDAPKEFLGVQAQVAINRGGPYLYFVVITRPSLPIVQPPAGDRDVVERKTDKDVNILVIRQFANKHGGYQTSASQINRLLDLAVLATEQTLKNAPALAPQQT